MNEHTMQVMARERNADVLRDVERGRLLREVAMRPATDRPRRGRRRFALAHRLARAAGMA